MTKHSTRAPARRRRRSTPAETESAGEAKKGQDADFVPTEKQRSYLLHLLEGYAAGGDVTDRALAERIKVHPTTISHWRDDPRFDGWISAAFDKFIGGGLKRLLVRAMTIAAKGSVRHMEFFARYSGQAAGESAPHGAGSGGDGGYTVVVLSPRPPALPTSGGQP